MAKVISRFVRETNGQDLIEYALLAALIALAATAAMKALGSTISQKFTDIGTTLTSPS